MLDSRGFDLWADGYDNAVGLSDEENTYPFAGYKQVLNRIFRIITEKPGGSVLDLGFGTGTLTYALYDRGFSIYGQDFSEKMTELAAAKMPDAHLYRGDFSAGLVRPLAERKYDFIVATYALHHLTDTRKIALISELAGHLESGGKLLIGDIAFEDRAALERCRAETGDDWDTEEIYFAADELKSAFPQLVFETISFCAGVFILDHSQQILPDNHG